MTNDVANDCGDPAEYVSMKFLLKQVYAAHTAKVKELELEIKKLKQELRNSQNTVSECQKCKEMESAYSACRDEYKNAVLEQTRRLKELELKFSTIEKKKKIPSIQEIPKANIFQETRPHLVPDTLSQSLNFPDSEIDPSENNNSRPLHYITSTAVALDSIENISKPSSQFKKPACEKRNQNGDISATPRDFLSSARKSNSCSIEDDIVLVPDTVDLCHSPITSNHETLKTKVSIGKENKDIEFEKSSTSKKRALSDGMSNLVQMSKPSRMSEEICPKANSVTVDPVSTSALSLKRKKLETEETGLSNHFNNFVHNSTSPSLGNDRPPIRKEESNVHSDDDFQSNANTDESRAWKISSKKGLQRKQLSLKGIKTSSHFKMTLEAPPENFKKPNYKQTKLFMSSFQLHKNSADDALSNCGSQDKDEECQEMDSEHNETSVACLSELASLANGDLSYIPDSLLLMGIKTQSLSTSSEIISPLETCAGQDKENDYCEEDVFLDEVLPIDEDNEVENCNSFDRLPVIEEPNYKYKEDTVRNKAKRKQLKGFECKDCEKYYDQLGLSEEEKKERLKLCSRHRAKYVPPPTPDHYWELDFPDTEECKARGYQAETQKVQLKTRRRRPLEL